MNLMQQKRTKKISPKDWDCMQVDSILNRRAGLSATVNILLMEWTLQIHFTNFRLQETLLNDDRSSVCKRETRDWRALVRVRVTCHWGTLVRVPRDLPLTNTRPCAEWLAFEEHSSLCQVTCLWRTLVRVSSDLPLTNVEKTIACFSEILSTYFTLCAIKYRINWQSDIFKSRYLQTYTSAYWLLQIHCAFGKLFLSRFH